LATLYFDCFSGASGDMILGAFLDLLRPQSIEDMEAFEMPDSQAH